MKKEIICEKCKGTGKIEIIVCSECGSKQDVGYYHEEDKYICQFCFFGKFDPEKRRKKFLI
jgi:RecJ-like exonuclease